MFMDDLGCLFCNGGRTMSLVSGLIDARSVPDVLDLSPYISHSSSFICSFQTKVGAQAYAMGQPSPHLSLPTLFTKNLQPFSFYRAKSSPHEPCSCSPKHSRYAFGLVIGVHTGSDDESCLFAVATFVPCTWQDGVSQLQFRDVTGPYQGT